MSVVTLPFSLQSTIRRPFRRSLNVGCESRVGNGSKPGAFKIMRSIGLFAQLSRPITSLFSVSGRKKVLNILRKRIQDINVFKYDNERCQA